MVSRGLPLLRKTAGHAARSLLSPRRLRAPVADAFAVPLIAYCF